MKKKIFLLILSFTIAIISCKKEEQKNSNALRQIVKSEDSASIDISQGYARLYVLLYDSSHYGGSLSILQKTLNSTCFTNSDILASTSVTIDRIHRVVFNHPTSPIHNKLEIGHYYMFFVKKGYKYEVLIESSGGIRRSCIPFTDTTEEFFSQHW
ncbi:MAG: hypothetical protein K1X33_09130 [Methanobacteriaceae archaeon]|nr:hypothetical protein [Methanobacteriaceae archaeon]